MPTCPFYRSVLGIITMKTSKSQDCCVKSKESLFHKCVRHANCVSPSGAWNPGSCLECSSLFRKADRDQDESSRECLKSLARLIGAKCGRHRFAVDGKIFFSSDVREKFDRPWFHKCTYVPSATNSEKTSSSRTTPSPHRSSANTPPTGITVGSVQAVVHSPPQNISLGGRIDNLIDPIQHDINAITTVQEGQIVTGQLAESIQHSNLIPSNFLNSQAPYLVTVDTEGQPGGNSSGLLPLSNPNTVYLQNFPNIPHQSGPSEMESQISALNSSVKRIEVATSQNSNLLAMFSKVLENLPKAPSPSSSNCPLVAPSQSGNVQTEDCNVEPRNKKRKLCPSPDPNPSSDEEDLENYSSRETSESEEEDELPELVHWPGCVPLTNLNQEMIEFLNKEEVPTAFLLPKSANFTEDGWNSMHGYLSYEELFIGLWKEQKFVVFKSKNQTASNLKAVLKMFQLGENLFTQNKEKISQAKAGDLRVFADQNTNNSDTFTIHKSKEDTFIIKDNVAITDMLSSMWERDRDDEDKKSSVSSLPWKFESLNEKCNGVLEFLQAPCLKKDSHELEELSQRFTTPVCESTRKNDRDARFSANANLSNWICLSQARDLVRNLVSSDSKSSEETSGALNGLEKLLDSSTAVAGSLTREALKRSVTSRSRARREATKEVEKTDPDISYELLRGPFSGEELFHAKARSKVESLVTAPAPRFVGPKNDKFSSKKQRSTDAKSFYKGKGQNSREKFRQEVNGRKFSSPTRGSSQVYKGKFHYGKNSHFSNQSHRGSGSYTDSQYASKGHSEDTRGKPSKFYRGRGGRFSRGQKKF